MLIENRIPHEKKNNQTSIKDSSEKNHISISLYLCLTDRQPKKNMYMINVHESK